MPGREPSKGGGRVGSDAFHVGHNLTGADQPQNLVDGQFLGAVAGSILPASTVRVGEDSREELVQDDAECVHIALEAEGVFRGDSDDFRSHPQDRT